MIVLKSDRALNSMRKAGRIVAEVHAKLAEAIQPGISTLKLDQLAEDYLMSCGATPSFKGYRGYPKSICTSINEEVVHGIPGDRILQEGDIISVDIGAYIDGFHGDATRTHGVGEISMEAQRLIEITAGALQAGIEAAAPGGRLGDISHAVQSFAETAGFGVVRDFVGHGIGSQMHEDPQVPNFGLPNRGPRLKPGLVLAIEPMVTAGDYRVRVLEDDWTVVTLDGSLCAHFEDTVAILEDGVEVLTIL
ncbi:MAG: type I methionyl aminopeptidase [Limnochordia bacterium]|nr:type I methionyl aminopeptidase [Limnochordia bacterium]